MKVRDKVRTKNTETLPRLAKREIKDGDIGVIEEVIHYIHPLYLRVKFGENLVLIPAELVEVIDENTM
jgi:hypothetical protein